MRDLEQAAKETLVEVRSNRDKKRAVLDGGRSGAGEGFGSEITSSIDQVKKLRVEKRTLIDGLKTDQERMRILE